MKTERIVGLTGRYMWLRRRVWFWQKEAYEAAGWEKSKCEGSIRPVMVKRFENPAFAGGPY